MKYQGDFFEDVLEVVKLIPRGRVTSYGAIAKYLGVARSSRMVGWALNKSLEKDLNIPAHRVVNRLGLLSGKMHFSSPTKMEEELRSEGIRVENNSVQNFNEVFWDPFSELP